MQQAKQQALNAWKVASRKHWQALNAWHNTRARWASPEYERVRDAVAAAYVEEVAAYQAYDAACKGV